VTDALGWRALSPALQHLNSTHNVNVPFILMNSFNTDDDTGERRQRGAASGQH
jgi:hypothetical protein